MLVVDASVVAPAVADGDLTGSRHRDRLRHETLAAPDLLRVEVVSVIRRQSRTGGLDDVESARAVDNLMDLPILVYPTEPLLREVWAMRHDVVASDACYVALAEVLACPLVTADARLARSPGVRCAVEVL